MRKIVVSILCLGLLVVTNSGCQTTQDNKTVEGAVVGGLVGATAGGIIGHQSHHGLEGAGIGAAVGALTGAVVGSQMKKHPQQAASGTSTANPSQMSMQQVVDLSKQGVHEDVIVDKIRLTNSRFTLSADEITYLKQQGVSEKIINAMQGI